MDLVVFATKPAVRVRMADDQDAAKAKEWIDIQVPASALKASGKPLSLLAKVDIDLGYAKKTALKPLGELDSQPVGEVQIAVLRCAKEVIEEQIQVLERRLGRIP